MVKEVASYYNLTCTSSIYTKRYYVRLFSFLKQALKEKELCVYLTPSCPMNKKILRSETMTILDEAFWA